MSFFKTNKAESFEAVKAAGQTKVASLKDLGTKIKDSLSKDDQNESG